MAQKLRPTSQAVDQFVSLQSSLQQVKALLSAGIGCITYLRGIFPEDAFDDHKLLAPRPPLTRNGTKGQASEQEKEKNDTLLSVKVKELKRGSSVEVDKLMDYVDKGATEAIEKGYLHQLIFAIYLDPDDPTNLVECYTFTFTYETDAQGNKRPELLVRNQLSGLVISSNSNGARQDERRKEGEVKRQVQQMIKNLITSTQLLDELPRRRYLTMRLLYTDETPADYEPPCFKPVPVESPAFTFATPRCEEPPDAGTLGSMSTGFHGVAVHSVSIAHLLDTAYDENVTLDEALSLNKHDASSRCVVWDGEALAQSITDEDARVVTPEPIAIKDGEGNFLPVGEVQAGEGEDMEKLRKKVGIEVDENAVVVARGELEEMLFDSNLSDNENLRMAIVAADPNPAHREGELPTQPDPVINRQRSYRPPVPFFDETNEQYAARAASHPATSQAGPSSQLEKVDEEEDEEMEDVGQQETFPMETQLFEYSQAGAVSQFDDSYSGPEPDTINTASQTVPSTTKTVKRPAAPSKTDKPTSPSAGPSRRKSTRKRFKMADDVCDCGDKDEDGAMISCGSASPCKVWKHLVCYGYTSADDRRIPEDFVCYRCRAETGKNESLLDPGREDEIEEALANLRSLALFRRAIAVVWDEGVLSMKDLAKRLSVDNATAAQVLKRLEAEEFLYEQVPVSKRLKGKNGSQVGSLKKGPLAVNKTPKSRKKKADYFTPGRGVEYDFSSKLEMTDGVVDKEGDGDELSDLSSVGSASPPRPAGPPSASRNPALLVEETPSPAHSQQQKPSSRRRSPNAMDEDDPIEQDTSQPDTLHLLPFTTPQDTIIETESSRVGGKSKGETAPSLSRQQQQQLPSASYAPALKADRKGNGKAVVCEKQQDERLQPFTNGKNSPRSFPVSQQQQQPQPLANSSSSSNKRRPDQDLSNAPELETQSERGVATRSKRRKVSEAERGIEC